VALDAIVAAKRRDVAERVARRPLASFRGAVAPSDRSLKAALAAPRTGFILECKKASPSRGVLRADYDAVAIARSYAPFADAISVLTDGPFFGGSLDDLAAVRAAVALPVLCKDFVVDPYQIYEARERGADAALLMCSVLRDDQLARCLAACRELEVDALVEVHDEAELARALGAGADIVGVNNRDLATLAIDLATSERLLPQIPAGVLAVCESGIERRQSIRALSASADAFLIGSHLMGARDLDAAVRELVFGRVKVCGLTRAADATAARAAGATFGGVVLWPGSPRHLDVAAARRLCRDVPLRWVGVFVDAPADDVAAAAAALGLAAVQLHGDEDGDHVAAVKARVPPGCEVWKARRIAPDATLLGDAGGADRLLCDGFHAGLRGGSGRRFDWRLCAAHPDKDRLVIGGGITADNAAAAEALGCYAIDLSSGVERAPGEKDPEKLAALFGALRGRAREGRR
jgi:indole-3-glycerol phosphate synthase/phosphoribosylanthranilate isomerase